MQKRRLLKHSSTHRKERISDGETGLPYLDIVKLLADNFDLPIAVYNVSGEYAMLKAAIQNGWLDERVILETLLSFRRAGATAILSYHSKEVLEKGFISHSTI